MAQLKPLRAWRYKFDGSKLERVIAPPYDVINEKEQDQLYKKSPYNIIRMILGKDHTDELPGIGDKYQRAAAYLQKWQDEHIFIQDARPAYYLYRQTYPHPETGKTVRRIGFFGLLKLEEFSSHIVLPHERTYAGPKEDRLHLIHAVQANLSPIFGLYEDKEHRLDDIFHRAMNGSPTCSFKGDRNTVHELWPIEDSNGINRISSFFESQSIMIADGHHRYETALAYRHAVRERSSRLNGTLSCDYVLAGLVNIDDTGLLIFPTHRLLRLETLPTWDGIERHLARYFEIDRFKISSAADWEQSLASIPKDRMVLGLQWGGTEGRRLVLRDHEAIRDEMPKGKSESWYRLDVNIVSQFILEKLLHISGLQLEKSVSYTRHLQEAVDRVRSGKVSLAIILRAPDVNTVKEVCFSGEIMPQKSTYFYPKLPSGLLIYQHERSV